VIILESLAPVFLLVVLGIGLQRFRFVTAAFHAEVNKLTYYIGLPALLFGQLAEAPISIPAVRPMVEVMLLGTLLTAGAAFGLARGLRLTAAATASFVQGSYRGNLVFVGLPLVFALPDVPLASGMSLHRAAVLAIAPVMLLYNVLAILVFMLAQRKLSWGMVRPLLVEIARTPPFIAIVVGLLFTLAEWRMPVAAARSFDMLGEMVLPFGLLGLGMTLGATRSLEGWQAASAGALVKAALSPAIGWLLCAIYPMETMAMKVVVIMMATPTALVSYTFAIELDGDGRVAAGIIVSSAIFSTLSTAWILGFL